MADVYNFRTRRLNGSFKMTDSLNGPFALAENMNGPFKQKGAGG
ncbi:hypothetical protein ABIB34_001742 [Rhodococcus sp. UYP5]